MIMHSRFSDLGYDTVTYVVPEGTTVIKSKDFQEHKCLKRIVIPDTVRKIEHYAFKNCYNLESVVLPNGLRKIECGTFYVVSV